MSKLAKMLAVGVVIVMAAAFTYGRDGFWVLIAGPPDLGPIEFATLELPTTPNYFLVCPEGVCSLAKPDSLPPAYRLTASKLQAIAREAWTHEARLVMVDSNRNLLQDRYVQRTAILRFPDTISVRFIAMEDDSSSLAIYSRSQIGRSDLGANRDRVLRWLSLLDQRVNLKARAKARVRSVNYTRD